MAFKQELEQASVAEGMRKAEASGEPFLWLTCTNRGASEVCEAALELLGLTKVGPITKVLWGL